ncbi:tetratricopeptide repeat protein [Nannocystis sp.]|uniref:tetratricopeptide repeat protein n=1 Tax=Nannocystis sp. TaxID=1962667 RepID=UPI0025F21AAA|nr:tetratricopeptide repeat protein [Nannocystis sp.]
MYVHGERQHDLPRAETWAEGRRRQAPPPGRRPGPAPAPQLQPRHRPPRRRPAPGQRAPLPRDHGPRRTAPRHRPRLPRHRPQRPRHPRDRQGRPHRSRGALLPLLALREAASAPTTRRSAWSSANLALVLYQRRDFTPAAAMFRRALALRERSLGSDHPATVETLNGLGAALTDGGDPTAGLEIYRRVLALEEQRRGLDNLDLFAPLNNLGNSLINAHDLPSAQPTSTAPAPCSSATARPTAPTTPLLLYNLAGLAVAQADPARAIPLIERSLALREQIYGAKHLEVGITLAYLAHAELAANHPNEADTHASHAVAILTDHPPASSGSAAPAWSSPPSAPATHTHSDALALARQATLDLRGQPTDSEPSPRPAGSSPTCPAGQPASPAERGTHVTGRLGAGLRRPAAIRARVSSREHALREHRRRLADRMLEAREQLPRGRRAIAAPTPPRSSLRPTNSPAAIPPRP